MADTVRWPEPLMQMWPVTPDVAVGVDQSLSIVLVTTEGKGPRWTITDVGALRDALDEARGFVAFEEELAANRRR